MVPAHGPEAARREDARPRGGGGAVDAEGGGGGGGQRGQEGCAVDGGDAVALVGADEVGARVVGEGGGS